MNQKMSQAMNNATVFDEPALEFAGGEHLFHPRDGLSLFGPVDSKGLDKPLRVTYGLIGTPSGVDKFKKFARALTGPIQTEPTLSEVLWPSFPGFEEAFHAILEPNATWERTVDPGKLQHAAKELDASKKVFDVVDLYLEQVRASKKSDDALKLFVLIVPDLIYDNCRIQSKVREGHGTKVTAHERKKRAVMGDLFGTYDPEPYAYSLDFRRQIKARVMEFEMPVQIIRESTLTLQEGGDVREKRDLTPLSDRAWNLGTAMYYKAGGKPWKLKGVRKGVCYVGVTFKNTEGNRTACCAAQMFLADGDGVVFLGDEGRWYSKRQGEYHLSARSAERLLAGVLSTYRDLNGQPLTEIFLHCRSSVSVEEYKGYLSACPPGAKLVVVRVAPERTGLRLYRHGTRPAMRGTFWPVSDRKGFLWGSGFKSRLRTYDGFGVPVPMCIEIQHGEASLEQVAQDVLALTKLNYNCCKLGEHEPVTIDYSGAVGEILVSNRSAPKRMPQFKYYI